ncbi:unnamed protein product [Scytosiphon promiscuus]
MAAPASTARQIPIVCPGHSRPLAEVSYCPETPDGTFLISGCHAKTPMIRNGSTGDWIGTFVGHKGAVWGVALDDTGLLAATASADFSARLWDAVTGNQIHEFVHKHIVKTVHFAADRSKLATAGHEGILRIFDVASPSSAPTEITVFPGEETPKVSRVVSKARWGKDPNTIITGSSDGFVRVWDVRSGEKVRKVQVAGAVMDLEISWDKSIATVAAGDTVHFLDTAEDFSELKRHTMPINFRNEGGASLHPGGKRFIAGGSDLWVRVFDYDTGAELECLKGHHGPVRCLRYAPDGKTYATGSEDGTIRLWQSTVAAAATTDGAAG